MKQWFDKILWECPLLQPASYTLFSYRQICFSGYFYNIIAILRQENVLHYLSCYYFKVFLLSQIHDILIWLQTFYIHAMHKSFTQFLSSFLNFFFSIFFSPHSICQTVVNFISELQEQMCQFQKEINSKIQEKKTSESSTDSSFPVVCPTESAEGRGKNFTVSCDGPSGGMHKLEEAPDRPLGNLREGSSDAEQLRHCGGERVGIVHLHDFHCYAQHGLSHFSVYIIRWN